MQVGAKVRSHIRKSADDHCPIVQTGLILGDQNMISKGSGTSISPAWSMRESSFGELVRMLSFVVRLPHRAPVGNSFPCDLQARYVYRKFRQVQAVKLLQIQEVGSNEQNEQEELRVETTVKLNADAVALHGDLWVDRIQQRATCFIIVAQRLIDSLCVLLACLLCKS